MSRSSATPFSVSGVDLADLASRLAATRAQSIALAAPLTAEDQLAQAHEDASPTKWHLAHTTWFFETFVLQPFLPAYATFDPKFNYCFNSYYEAHGARQPRAARGLLTRPTSDEVRAYRAHVDAGLSKLHVGGHLADPDVSVRVELGIQHEQQHQELLLTDILALFAASPIEPAYKSDAIPLHAVASPRDVQWLAFEGGLQPIGATGEGFCFDNERPVHTALVHPFRIADRLVTNGEWLAFMNDGGYRTAAHWLSDGWSRVQRDGWAAPLYWQERDGQWSQMSLWGRRPVDLAAPVCHVSYYEADAFARWAGRRLPTEFEWESVAAALPVKGTMLGTGAMRPLPCAGSVGGPQQMFGDVWEWTQSAYQAYPGYRPAPGAIGEYNGKFMCQQQVLRGASCATPEGHSRASYRNFFYPHQRWQFCGLRLADEAL